MNIHVTIICDNLVEERACDLIATACATEVQQPTQNEFTIETKTIARAADLLHAIRSVLDRARNEKTR